MRQPATVQLGRSKSGLPIGYRLLDTNRSQVQPFTRKDVTETSVPGTYAAVGVNEPTKGGFIVWGTAEQDMAEAPICCEMPMHDPMPAMRQALDLLMQNIVAIMPKTPVVQMNTQPFEQGLHAVTTTVAETQRVIGGHLAEVDGQMAAMRERVDRLVALNDVIEQHTQLVAIRDHISEMLSNQAPSEAIGTLSARRTSAAEEKQRKQLAAIDRFLAKVEGK